MTTDLLDPTNPIHAKALGMLDRDLIAWFTTVGADGRPHAVPVWYLWHDDGITVLTEPASVKATNLRRGSPALVHLHAGGESGDDVVVLHGTATVTDGAAAQWISRFGDVYGRKYRDAIAGFGVPVEALAERFSSVVRFTPDKVSAW